MLPRGRDGSRRYHTAFCNTEMREVLTWPIGTPANVYIGNNACIVDLLLG